MGNPLTSSCALAGPRTLNPETLNPKARVIYDVGVIQTFQRSKRRWLVAPRRMGRCPTSAGLPLKRISELCGVVQNDIGFRA